MVEHKQGFTEDVLAERLKAEPRGAVRLEAFQDNRCGRRRQVAKPFPLADSGPEFYLAQGKQDQGVARGAVPEGNHAFRACLADIELHQSTGVDVVERHV